MEEGSEQHGAGAGSAQHGGGRRRRGRDARASRCYRGIGEVLGYPEERNLDRAAGQKDDVSGAHARQEVCNVLALVALHLNDLAKLLVIDDGAVAAVLLLEGFQDLLVVVATLDALHNINTIMACMGSAAQRPCSLQALSCPSRESGHQMTQEPPLQSYRAQRTTKCNTDKIQGHMHLRKGSLPELWSTTCDHSVAGYGCERSLWWRQRYLLPCPRQKDLHTSFVFGHAKTVQAQRQTQLSLQRRGDVLLPATDSTTATLL